jgi:hypothetical protein
MEEKNENKIINGKWQIFQNHKSQIRNQNNKTCY